MSSYFNLLKGEALSQLSSLPSNSVHAVITDPPYGLTSEHDIHGMLGAWLAGRVYVNEKNGYGGTEWDNSVPGPELWQEVRRVLMPGGFVLAFGASRTSHLTTIALELAGFEIRDSLHWVYTPGCQRSQDLAKHPDLANSPELRASIRGMRTTLRPGHEPITVARKKLYEGQDLLESVIESNLGAIRHSGFTNKKNLVASNVLVVHELECGERGCVCGLAQDPASKYGTPIYPATEIPLSSLEVPKPNKAERPKSASGSAHETVKPVTLMRTLIRAFSGPGQICLDPFLGSGTTAEAALMEGRHIVGCEITPKYWELIQSRFNSLKMSGLDVRRGSPFDLQMTSVLSGEESAQSF